MMKRICIVLAAALCLALPRLAIADDSAAAQASQAQPPQGKTQPPPAQTQPPPAQPQPPPAETQPAPTPAPPVSPPPGIEKIMQPTGEPPAELKKLSMLKGSWTTSMKMEGSESTTPTKVTYDWTFDGMHLEGNHQFQMNGKPRRARSTWGWDPDKKQYQVVWVDSRSPTAYVYNGTFANDVTMVLYTTYGVAGKAVTEKMTYIFADADNFTMKTESDMTGEMKTIMEQKGTRAKAAASKSASKGAKPKKPAAATTPKKSG